MEPKVSVPYEYLPLDPVLTHLNLLETEILYEFISLKFATCRVCVIIFHSIARIFGDVENFQVHHYLIFFHQPFLFSLTVCFHSVIFVTFVSAVGLFDHMSK